MHYHFLTPSPNFRGQNWRPKVRISLIRDSGKFAQYLKLLNTSEFGENQAVLFCFDFLPRLSKKHQKNTNFLKKLAVKSQITLKYQILDLKSQYRSIFPELGTSAMWDFDRKNEG